MSYEEFERIVIKWIKSHPVRVPWVLVYILFAIVLVMVMIAIITGVI